MGLDDSVQFLCQDALEANVSEAGILGFRLYALRVGIAGLGVRSSNESINFEVSGAEKRERLLCL